MLRKAPVDDLKAYLDRWAAACMSCAPADRRLAEEGIRRAYAAGGLAPPDRIVWCGGPLEIAKRLAGASADEAIGDNVKAEIFDRVREKAGTFAEIFGKEIVIAAIEINRHGIARAVRSGLNRCLAASTAVNRAVVGAVDARLCRLSVRVRHLALRWRGLPHLLPRSTFADIAIGPEEWAALGVYAYLHDALPMVDIAKPMQGLWQIARGAGWIVPHEWVCWVSERPSLLQVDAAARLHGPDGPALQYPDGWSWYAWKGIEVPAWMIEHPEEITLAAVSDVIDPVLRNAMIEIMTPERFVGMGGASRVCEDETGVLWRKLWGYRGVTIGSWTAVEVENGTAEPDGSRRRHILRVPSGVRSPREAVAWTYGISPERYAELDVRT